MGPKHAFILLFMIFSRGLFANPSESIVFTKAEIINEHTARIPFKLVDHLIVVEAELYDKKGNFIIDTGSETLILNKVHFPVYSELQTSSRKTSGVMEIVDNPVERTLNSFLLHNLSLNRVHSNIINLSHIEKSKKMHLLGIIGFSVLKDYEVFIDLFLNQITLTKVDKDGKKLDSKVYLEKITDSLDFRLVKHTIVVNGWIGEQKVKFGLDSGAEFNQINKSVGKKALKHFTPERRLKLMGAGNRKIEVLAGKLRRVKLSETVYVGPMRTILTNLRKMNEAYGTSLDGVLGYEFLKYKRTIINYKKEKLYFVKYPITGQ
ncbi:hypothetical protein GWK08_07965 [Leptobacterium flavescens]|uniref:Peptidase A2 domain-containing protein n=1 Tax=Leptobacterium flavescens TaxID=472055 RepID=A0A6P0UNF1_9FLAO|nr:retropepsin-like aspartic protease [Leptobacterium flavescens]NER13369.1 hypothetical protein [Leptobacterium flavescens]